MDLDSLNSLRARLGDEYVSWRLRRQINQIVAHFTRSEFRIYFENWKIIPFALNWLLRVTGALRRAQDNAQRIVVEHQTIKIPNLPKAFEGYRLLQLSDLHIDGFPDAGQCLFEVVRDLTCDACVITGDYRFRTSGIYDEVLARMDTLVQNISARDGIYGILGNHDYFEMIPGLERAGITLLINESTALERGGERIWLLGVDDAHFYDAANIGSALQNIHADEIKVLLIHSPELIAEAEALGIHYYLCGHTHGGQVCLPGSAPLITNARCAKRYTAGAWHFGAMPGYTSRGTGSSGLFVRLFCPPEVTIHILRSAG